jgi:molybdopterin converting factor small subunit
MTVSVKFIGSFRSLSRKNKLELRLEESSPIRDVVKRIVEELPELEQAFIDPESESPKTNMLVLVNGKEISVLDRLETMIKDEDEVVFVPVVHGG